MTPEQRSAIVRRLRAVADAVEAGGDIDAYSYDPMDGHDHGTVREASAIEPYLDDDCWGEDVERTEWGVLVPVQVARVVEQRLWCGSGFDTWQAYAMVDPDTYVEPPLGPCDDEDCERCHGGKP